MLTYLDCAVPGLIKHEIEAAYTGSSLTYGPCTSKYELLKCKQPLTDTEIMETVMMLMIVLTVAFVPAIDLLLSFGRVSHAESAPPQLRK